MSKSLTNSVAVGHPAVQFTRKVPVSHTGGAKVVHGHANSFKLTTGAASAGIMVRRYGKGFFVRQHRPTRRRPVNTKLSAFWRHDSYLTHNLLPDTLGSQIIIESGNGVQRNVGRSNAGESSAKRVSSADDV
jgi:hypothetical protein